MASANVEGLAREIGLGAAVELFEELPDLVSGEVDEPAVGAGFDAWQALAADCVADHDAGRPAGDGQPVEGLAEGGEVVSVAAARLPAEGLELLPEGLEGDELLGADVGLECVPIDDRHEVVEAMGGGHERRLPHAPLVELAVAQHDVDLVLPAAQADVVRHPDRDAEEVAE